MYTAFQCFVSYYPWNSALWIVRMKFEQNNLGIFISASTVYTTFNVFPPWGLSKKNLGVYIFSSTLYTDQSKVGHTRLPKKNSSHLYFCFHNVHNLNQPPEKAQDKINEVYVFLLPKCTQISFWPLNNEDEIFTK